jgi:hypothetical protein
MKKNKLQVLDVDKYLEESGVEIIIKGKSYVVRDIPVEVQEELRKEFPDFKEVIKILLDLKDVAILDGYGVVALSKIVTAVHENLLQRGALPVGSPVVQSAN